MCVRLQDRQFVVQRCGTRRQLCAPCRARTALGEALQVEVEALQVELERDRRDALAAVVPDDGEGRQDRDGREQKQNAAAPSLGRVTGPSHFGEFIIVNLVLRHGATPQTPNQ